MQVNAHNLLSGLIPCLVIWIKSRKGPLGDINIIAGLLGMNVGGIPLADHPAGFWIVVAVIVSFTGVAAWIVFRNKGE